MSSVACFYRDHDDDGVGEVEDLEGLINLCCDALVGHAQGDIELRAPLTEQSRNHPSPFDRQYLCIRSWHPSYRVAGYPQPSIYS